MSIKLVNFIDLNDMEKEMVLEWRNHKDIRKYMYNQETILLENHLKYIKLLKISKDKRYFLVKRDFDCIGVIYFTEIKKDSCYFGLYSKPNLKGVGDTLLKTIIDYAFNNLKIKTLKLEVLESNIRAIKLYKRFGFIEKDRRDNIVIMELKREN